ncbi:MAG: GNAT family N-acetyltransferase [Ferruginibacter sp.]
MTGILKIATLQADDMLGLVDLVNSAYRGEDSKKGWTSEADLIEGSLRTDLPALIKILQKPGAAILTCSDDKTLLGCVYLQQEGTGLYLGMLSVSPAAQGMGIGKKLLTASEKHARNLDCNNIFMTVIDVRHELIAWYERHGYTRTGQTKPFDAEESFGVPKQPLQFIVLKKAIGI